MIKLYVMNPKEVIKHKLNALYGVTDFEWSDKLSDHIDSLDKVELIIKTEQDLNYVIPDNAFTENTTIQDIVNYFEENNPDNLEV